MMKVVCPRCGAVGYLARVKIRDRYYAQTAAGGGRATWRET
ncbi:MAG: hypothetical protein ACO2PN_21545 [Pyrobaculum sp.]